jgi:NADH-quinone oxidoreductase subunit L
MMLALGIGAYVAAIFHLFTHAFFKALLFLGSGSVNHATNTFDMRLMGGLRKTMPITFATFLIGTLSLAGIFPLAGFWSKDEILGDAWAHEPYLFWMGLVAAGLTALYMGRVIFLTFYGEYRGGGEPEDGAHAEHQGEPHESPRVMTLPLMALAVMALVAGVFNLPWKFIGLDHEVEYLLIGALPDADLVEEAKFRYGVAAASTAVALGGLFVAWVVYGAKIVPSTLLARLFTPIRVPLENRYYFDVLYERVAVDFLFYRVGGGALALFDRLVVDGAVNGIGRTARRVATVGRYVQTGEFQTYGAVAFSGFVFAVIVVLVVSPL